MRRRILVAVAFLAGIAFATARIVSATPTAPVSATQLQGKGVSPTAPTANQLLQYNAGTGAWTPVSAAVVVDAVTLGGDLAGTPNNATVGAIQNQTVTNAVPTTGEVLSFSAGSWAPSYTASVTTINGNGTIPAYASGPMTHIAQNSYVLNETYRARGSNGKLVIFRMRNNGDPAGSGGGNCAAWPCTYDIPVIGLGGTANQEAGCFDDIINGTMNVCGPVPTTGLSFASVVVNAVTTLTDTAQSSAGNCDASVCTETVANAGFIWAGTSGGATAVASAPTWCNSITAGSVCTVAPVISRATLGATINGPLVLADTPLNYLYGGIGVSTLPANGKIPIGNGSGYTVAVPTGANGISVTPGAGTLAFGITAGSIANASLASSSVTINTTAPITGGGALSLGGTMTVAMPAATSVANGYMTSTYAAKLDGLPASAVTGCSGCSGVCELIVADTGGVTAGKIVVWSGTGKVQNAGGTLNLTTVAGVATTTATSGNNANICTLGNVSVASVDASCTAGALASTSATSAGNAQCTVAVGLGAGVGRISTAQSGSTATIYVNPF